MEPWGSREKEPAERREAGTSLGTARGRQHFKKISKENLKGMTRFLEITAGMIAVGYFGQKGLC